MLNNLWRRLRPQDEEATNPKGKTAVAPLEQFRAQIDDFIGHHPQSPLSTEDRYDFEGLNYYEANDDLIITATVTRLPDDEPLVKMDTSTNEVRLYRRWGQFSFTIDGQPAQLTIYSDPHGHDLFLPFKDSTNGQETYGAGRYLDNHRPGLHQLSNAQMEVDFNYSYNPYCAYSVTYSCPLPPRENWLNVPIRAGEKKFRDEA